MITRCLLALGLTFWSWTSALALPDCARPFTLALHDHGLLYSAETDSGIDKDVANELIRRSRCKVTVSLMPRARIWQLIEAGALDFSLSGITNAERDRFAGFAWYFNNKYYLLVRQDSGIKSISDFERNDRLLLGAIRSFRYSETANKLVDRLDGANRVSLAGGLAPLYQALMLNHIQAMIIEPFDFPALDEKKIRALTQVHEFNDPPVLHGLIMSRKSLPSEEQDKWRQIMRDMRADGSLRRIFEKYFKPEMVTAMLDF